MPSLTPTLGEVIINRAVEVRVVAISGTTVKLGFTFPAGASVLPEEVAEAIKLANRAAAEPAGLCPRSSAGARLHEPAAQAPDG